MGRLTIVPQRVVGPALGPEITNPDGSEPPPWSNLVSDTTTAAIEIRLIEEDGGPSAHTRFEVILPDGSRRTGRLDVHGMARVLAIPTGTCKVFFPDLDMESWSHENSEPL